MTNGLLPGPLREGSKAREGVLVFLLVVAAVASGVSFEVAVHPERVADPRHHARFAEACAALPALGAVRVRSAEPLYRFQAFGEVAGITPDTKALFRTGRYLYAPPQAVAEAVARLRRREPPDPPPSAPDLSRYYSDALGPYECDLVLAPGKRPADVRGAIPSAQLTGEPLAREAEEREAASVARALLISLPLLTLWIAWRRGRREAEERLLAALVALAAAGVFGIGVDRWSVAALLLVAGAPSGWPLLAAAPCLLFPTLGLERMGFLLCLGGAVRLRGFPARAGARKGVLKALALTGALGVAGLLLLDRVPVLVVPRPEVAAEPAALLVPPESVPAAAKRLRDEGFDVTGDERLVPPSPDIATRRGIQEIYALADPLARLSEGDRRARFEDAKDAASRVRLYLPRDLRARLRTTDGRAVLWAKDADREDLESARLYRERGSRDLAGNARLAAILVFGAGALGLAFFEGAAGRIARRFLGAAAGSALLFVLDPAEADLYVLLLPLVAAAPAVGPALALGAAAVFLPALAWPAVALLVAALVAGYRSMWKPTSPG